MSGSKRQTKRSDDLNQGDNNEEEDNLIDHVFHDDNTDAAIIYAFVVFSFVLSPDDPNYGVYAEGFEGQQVNYYVT